MTARRELYIVRHGESVWNVERRLTGWSDVALTQRGLAQASALRPLLERRTFTRVWASPLQRAYQTGVLAWGTPHEVDDRLREFHFGDHEGVPVTALTPDVIARFRQFDSFSAPGGESGAGFHARVDAFFDTLAPGAHLVFTHGGVVRRALERAGRAKFVDNAGVTVIDWDAGEVLDEWPNPLARPAR